MSTTDQQASVLALASTDRAVIGAVAAAFLGIQAFLAAQLWTLNQRVAHIEGQLEAAARATATANR